MVDYNFGGTGLFIEPYAEAESFNAPDCSPYNIGDPPGFVCGDRDNPDFNGNVICGPPLPADFQTCQDTASNFVVATNITGTFYNCYIDSGLTQSVHSVNCGQSVGFKNCYSHKLWQGIPPYTSKVWQAPTKVYEWFCGNCSIQEEVTTPETTHYLAISATGNSSNVFTVITPEETTIIINTSTEASNAMHVDTSGNIYTDSCFSSSAGYADPEEGAEAAQTMFDEIGKGNNNITDIFASYCVRRQFWIDSLAVDPDVIIQTDTVIDIRWNTGSLGFVCDGPTGDNYVRLVVDLTANTFDEYNYDNCFDYHRTYETHYSFTGTQMSYTENLEIHTLTNDTYYTKEISSTLSTPYTSQEVYDDSVLLLSKWDLGDDKQLPFRTDSDVTTGPVVFRDEGQAQPTIGVCQDVILYTGDIQGLPAPEGIDMVWSPFHRNYCTCDSLVNPGCLIHYVRSYGAWSDYRFPRATAWLDNREASSVPQYAFALSNQFYSVPSSCNESGPQKLFTNEQWLCKYAEIILPKPSINFFRPCGLDRFQVNPLTSSCVVSATDNVLTLEPSADPTLIATGNYVWTCGVGGIEDGCYIVTRDSDFQITLDTLIVSASMLPDIPLDNCGDGLVTSLRWQSLRPTICGRLEILSVSQSLPITCSLSEPTYLVDSDGVFIEGAGNLNGYWQVGIIDNQTIILSGSNGIGEPAYIGGGRIYSDNTPDWKWYDSEIKGQFSNITWDYDFRDVGEWSRLSASKVGCSYIDVPTEPRPNNLPCGLDQNIKEVVCNTECVKYTACSPSVAYYSPNSESFDKRSSINLGFNPNGILIDSDYGSLWQGVIKQSDNDPYWISPPCPCTYDPETDTYSCNGFEWIADNGSCLEDTEFTKYFPAPPQVESICYAPEGAPTPPNALGCLSVSELTAPCPGGNVCNSPSAYAPSIYDYGEQCNLSSVFPYAQPWIEYLNKVACVCADGRFAEDYKKEGIECHD